MCLKHFTEHLLDVDLGLDRLKGLLGEIPTILGHNIT